jgi:hypothetical protein
MKTNLMTISLFCSFFIISLVQILQAQQIPIDKKNIMADKAAIMDGRRDLDRLLNLIIKWDRLRKGNKQAALNRVELQIAAEFSNDLKEVQYDASPAQKEVNQSESTAEVKRSKKEMKRERRDKKALKDNARDLRDDKRDLKDVIRDVKKIKEILQKKRSVSSELISRQKKIDTFGKEDDKAMQQK